MRVSTVAKTIVAGIFAVLSVITPVLTTVDYLDVTNVIQMVLAILATLGVFVVPNAPQPTIMKTDPEAGTVYTA